MSSTQRRRGQVAEVYQTKVVTDRRGNEVTVVDDLSKTVIKAAFIPDRSARAELPGQQQIDVYRMILSHEVPGQELWSRVYWRGVWWDIVTPPGYHHGTKHVRHNSLSIRQRPSDG